MASPPSYFGSSKVCVVLGCNGHRGNYFCIYIVDLFEKNSSGSHRSPNICVPLSLGVMASCVFGSKLFMFEPRPSRFERLGDPYKGRRVLTYEIPETPVFNLKLKAKDVVEAPYLNHSRLGTAAIPTPDGKKLLVFAHCICQWKDGKCLDFELYDPDTGSWRTLPGISQNWQIGGKGIQVTDFCYIKNVLSLQTNRGVFVLDMEFPDGMFKNLTYEIPILAPPRVADADGYFIAVHTHDLYLTPSVAQDTGRGIILEYPGLLFSRASRSIMLLQNNNDNEVKFCISHIGFRSATSSHPHLVLSLYRLDLDKYTKEMNKMKEEETKEGRRYLPGTTLMRSYDFRLEAHSRRSVSRCLNTYALP